MRPMTGSHDGAQAPGAPLNAELEPLSAGFSWTDLLIAAVDPDRFAELVASRDAVMRHPERAERIAAERIRLMSELRADLAGDGAP